MMFQRSQGFIVAVAETDADKDLLQRVELIDPATVVPKAGLDAIARGENLRKREVDDAAAVTSFRRRRAVAEAWALWERERPEPSGRYSLDDALFWVLERAEAPIDVVKMALDLAKDVDSDGPLLGPEASCGKVPAGAVEVDPVTVHGSGSSSSDEGSSEGSGAAGVTSLSPAAPLAPPRHDCAVRANLTVHQRIFIAAHLGEEAMPFVERILCEHAGGVR